MIGLHQYLFFICSAMVLAVVPGPDIIFVVTQAITNGKKPALATVLGLGSGCLVHTTLAALGGSVLFQTSQLAFNILKWFGICYLLYLAYNSFNCKKEKIAVQENAQSGYLRGILMNVLNPKVLLFFLAFLPQFVPSNTTSYIGCMMLLGGTFAVVSMGVFVICALLGSKLNNILIKNDNFIYYAVKLSSLVYLVLAILLLIVKA